MKKIKEVVDSLSQRIFNKNDGKIDAATAYSIAKYNEVISPQEIFNKFIEDTNQMISVKSSNKYFSVVVDLEDDLIGFIDNIRKYYEDLHYVFVILDSTVDHKINGTSLFISWRK